MNEEYYIIKIADVRPQGIFDSLGKIAKMVISEHEYQEAKQAIERRRFEVPNMQPTTKGPEKR